MRSLGFHSPSGPRVVSGKQDTPCPQWSGKKDRSSAEERLALYKVRKWMSQLASSPETLVAPPIKFFNLAVQSLMRAGQYIECQKVINKARSPVSPVYEEAWRSQELEKAQTSLTMIKEWTAAVRQEELESVSF
jgi:hypothetical protein